MHVVPPSLTLALRLIPEHHQGVPLNTSGYGPTTCPSKLPMINDSTPMCLQAVILNKNQWD